MDLLGCGAHEALPLPTWPLACSGVPSRWTFYRRLAELGIAAHAIF